MLTEQLLTEDIEIDDEQVDRNTAHSLFFDTYYQSLKDIEFFNRQVLEFQDNFRWYTKQLNEVDRLANGAKIPNSSTILVGDLPQIIKLDRIRDEKKFQLLNDGINQLAQIKHQQRKEVSSIEQSSTSHIATLNSQLTNLADAVQKSQDEIHMAEYSIRVDIREFSIQAALLIAIILSLNFSFATWLLLPALCVELFLVIKQL
jgi:hypothetical protein